MLFIVQVLNGLLCRDNQKEAISIPIGIIPAGSDNSLVWTVLGVRDPVSAALAIVKVCMILEGFKSNVRSWFSPLYRKALAHGLGITF